MFDVYLVRAPGNFTARKYDRNKILGIRELHVVNQCIVQPTHFMMHPL